MLLQGHGGWDRNVWDPTKGWLGRREGDKGNGLWVSLGSTALKQLQACKTRSAKVFPGAESPAGRAAIHHRTIRPSLPAQDGIPEPAAKQCAKQLVSALEFIHSRGLVYRDVKPENVLLFDPECRRIKLTDFGLTRPKGTKLKLVAGVIPYTAPELSNTADAQGVPIDTSLDAWAFGVLLFCLLTGYFPWEQSLPEDPFFEDFMLWQETGLDEDLPRHWKRLTAEAALMLRSLLALDPAERGPVGGALRYVDRPWRLEDGAGEGAAAKP